jgi:UDP-2,4-diacetamido-2,4,6-trideoxy-beta-L-altropyranose hydrolase
MSDKPIVLVRVDAGLAAGSGHVMRCAAIGMRLMVRGARVYFVCAGLSFQLSNWVRSQGFDLTEIHDEQIIDWQADLEATLVVARNIGMIDLLIVDHYRLELNWEFGMRPHVRRIFVVDDLADRHHDCDLLLDQNLHEGAHNRYANLVPKNALQFLGPQYALLRNEFDQPGLIRSRDGSINLLLVFFGGTDPGNQTIKVIDALRALGSKAPQSLVVLGPASPHRVAIHKSVLKLPNVKVIDSTDQMAVLIAQADLAVGTCGVAAWERCALGLPCLVVVTAENQRDDAEILHKFGAIEHLGDASEVNSDMWEAAIRRAMDKPERVFAMGLASAQVMVDRQAALAKLERTLVDGLF